MAQLPENPEEVSVASGETDVFPTVWTFEDASQVVVSVDAGGGFLEMRQGVDYDVLAGDWLNDGADIVFRGGKRPAAGHLVARVRRTSVRQDEAFGDLETFRPRQSEHGYDRLTRMVQERAYEAARGVRLPLGEDGFELPPRAVRVGRTKVIGSNPDGDLTLLDGASFKGDPGGTTDLIGTLQQAAGMNIDAGYDAVRTTGYRAPGDSGAGLYRRAAGEPAHAGKFRSADGKWWELARQRFTAAMFGAKGDGVSDDSAALNTAVQVIKALGGGTLLIEAGDYNIGTTTFYVPAAVNVKKDAGAKLIYGGTGIAMHVTAEAPDLPHRFGSWDVRVQRSSIQWHVGEDASSVGVRFTNIREAQVTVYQCDNFHAGVQLCGDGNGSVDNSVNLGLIRNNRYGIQSLRLNGGWANQNVYSGGAVRVDGGYANIENFPVKLLDVGDNGNLFSGINLEGGIQAPGRCVDVSASYNVFFSCRYEQQGAGTFRVAPGVLGTSVFGGYGNTGPDAALFQDEGQETVVIGSRGAQFWGDAGVYGGPAIIGRARSNNTAIVFQGRSAAGAPHFEVDGVGRVRFYDGAGKGNVENPSIIIDATTSSILFGDTAGASSPQPTFAPSSSSQIDLLNKIFAWGASSRQRLLWSRLDDATSIIGLSAGVGFVTSNTAPTNITGVTGGVDGQVFYLKAGDGVTTLVHSGAFRTRTGANVTLSAGQVVQFVATGQSAAVMV